MSAKKPVCVLIAVPSFRGTVMVHTMQSLLKTAAMFGEFGIKSGFINVDSAEISIARNSIATYAWREESISHLLFVDDDMTFEPEAVMDLLRAGKPIVGCICPKRMLNVERIWEAGRAGLTLEQAKTEGVEFVTKLPPSGTLQVADGLAQVEGIGMGVTLIRRDVLTTMVERNVVRKRRLHSGGDVDTFGNTFLYGFFDNIPTDDGDYVLSEDLSFCQRWKRDCGGEIWATVDREIGHIGSYIFTGRYIDRLRMGKI